MLILVDIGNTRTKVAFADGNKIGHFAAVDTAPLQNLYAALSGTDAEGLALCTVVDLPQHLRQYLAGKTEKFLEIGPDIKLPFKTAYPKPVTLGADRISLCAGALAEGAPNVLVVSLGTCITYDLVAERKHMGGAISPGIAMRLKAMHENTGRLPLADAAEKAEFPAKSTESCLAAGALLGAAGEINHFIGLALQENKKTHVFISGGDAGQALPYIQYAHQHRPQLLFQGIKSLYELNFN